MSKLHKRFLALGDLEGQSLESISAACGPPREARPFAFTDVGEGTRATWSDGRFTAILNFDGDGRFCGVHHHRNLEPWLWIAGATVLLVAAALLAGAWLRARNAGPDTPEALAALLLAERDAWYTADTAGAGLFDLDGDGEAELVAVDTSFVYYEDLAGDYFGGSAVRVYDIAGGALALTESYASESYCFALTVETPAGPRRAMQNESWLGAGGSRADGAAVEADLLAMAEAYFAENQG